jgi:hypothetical protein
MYLYVCITLVSTKNDNNSLGSGSGLDRLEPDPTKQVRILPDAEHQQ